MSVGHKPYIDRVIMGATTVEDSLREVITEVEEVRISKEIWKKNNKRNLLSNPQLSCKVVSV